MDWIRVNIPYGNNQNKNTSNTQGVFPAESCCYYSFPCLRATHYHENPPSDIQIPERSYLALGMFSHASSNPADLTHLASAPSVLSNNT